MLGRRKCEINVPLPTPWKYTERETIYLYSCWTSTLERGVVSFKIRPLNLRGKNCRFPLNMRLSRLQTLSWNFGDQKTFFCCQQPNRNRNWNWWNKGKSIPVQDWTGPEVSRRLGLSYFKTVGTCRW